MLKYTFIFIFILSLNATSAVYSVGAGKQYKNRVK
jgi:hypothetical protein